MKCPRCGGIYETPPALSRVDNATEICPWCGISEALYSFYQSDKTLPGIDQPIPAPDKTLGYPPQDQEVPLVNPAERAVVARVFAFSVILREAGVLSDTDEYFDRPWKWDGEYQLWIRAGSPQPPEWPDHLEANWFPFIQSLQEGGFL